MTLNFTLQNNPTGVLIGGMMEGCTMYGKGFFFFFFLYSCWLMMTNWREPTKKKKTFYAQGGLTARGCCGLWRRSAFLWAVPCPYYYSQQTLQGARAGNEASLRLMLLKKQTLVITGYFAVLNNLSEGGLPGSFDYSSCYGAGRSSDSNSLHLHHNHQQRHH